MRETEGPDCRLLQAGEGSAAAASRHRMLLRFLALYGALFLSFGVLSPFMGAFLSARQLSAEAVGTILAAATATRLLAGPLVGSLADRIGLLRLVLAACLVAAAAAAFCYVPAEGFWLLLAIGVAQAAALAPTTAIADALSLAAMTKQAVEYGWIRGGGSGAFIAGTLLAGQAIASFGLDIVVWLNGGLLGVAAIAVRLIPDLGAPRAERPVRVTRIISRMVPQPGLRRDELTSTDSACFHGVFDGVSQTSSDPPSGHHALAQSVAARPRRLSTLRQPMFMRLMLVAALIQGSHAFHDAFVVIRWRSLGIDSFTIGLLWSEAVAAEVVVFLFLGAPLLRRFGPAGASIIAALGGMVRWAVLATTGSVAAAALVEPLHGLTFALQHLACMQMIATLVPAGTAATAQAVYGNVAVGATTTVMTLAAGVLYAHFGAAGFWAMAGVCAASVPLAAGLTTPKTHPIQPTA